MDSDENVASLQLLKNLPCPLRATKVKILSTSGEQLQMFEVQVLANGRNVALQGYATQSSTLKNYVASNAVDNDNVTFSHTYDEHAFFEINLVDSYQIESIKIFNRFCGSEIDLAGCLCRLSYATLLLLDDIESILTKVELGDTCGMMIVTVSLSYPCLTNTTSTSGPTALPSDVSYALEPYI